MQNLNVFRHTPNDNGIYAELDAQVPKDSALRSSKPDGSWLSKVGQKYPGAISFWTAAGMKKYYESGLRDWHYSVTEGVGKLLVAEVPPASKILYQDEFQVIAMPDDFKITKEYPFTYEGPRPWVPQPPTQDLSS